MVVQANPRAGFACIALVASVFAGLLACNNHQLQNGVIRRGEDVLSSGAAAQVLDSASGDAMLAGRDVRFAGAIGGDYLGVGGTQTIEGRIHGALRAAGGRVHVMAVVERNATVAGGTVELDRVTVVGRNAYLAGGTVHIDGTVHGDLLVSGGTVVLNGQIDRDVEVSAGKLFVGPRAAIAGGLRYRVPNGKVHIDPSARVKGPTTALPVQTGGGSKYVLGILWMFSFIVVGGVVVALLPRLMADAAEFVQELPGRSALVGLGWIILLPIAIILVACTVIGIPLALLTVAIYGILLYIGRVTLAIWLGKRVLGHRAREGRSGTLLSFGLGGFVLLLIRIIPVIGPIAMCVATVVGLGALLLRVHRLRMTTAGTMFV